MDFTVLLQAELDRRQARNPRYSLRAFARDLHTDHSTLSQWLRGRRHLSRRRMHLVGKRLGLDAETIEQCCIERRDRAVLEAIRKRPGIIGSRRLARRVGASTDDVNIALHRLLFARRLRMPSEIQWIAEENANA